jgi:SsrA-binding protein
MKPDKKQLHRSVAENRSARHEFFILESVEAGVELMGSEVKSIRAGGISLKEGYAHIVRGELFLEGVHISPYEYASSVTDPLRSRRLLMHRREINRLDADMKQRRLTLVPLRVYFKNGRAKLELGLARGKKTHDKRAAVKERESRRELDRAKTR